VTRYTEGFSHFVTSMTAPVASGWSVRRVGLSPTGKRRLSRRTQQAGIAGSLDERLISDPSLPFPPAPGTQEGANCGPSDGIDGEQL